MSALAVSMSGKGFSHEPKKPKKGKKHLVQYRICEIGEKTPQHPFVRCLDGRHHRYMNANAEDLVESPSFCPRCSYSYAETTGMALVPCSECQWDAVAEWIQTVEEECGINLMSQAPDHVEIRMRSKNFDAMIRRHRTIPMGNFDRRI